MFTIVITPKRPPRPESTDQRRQSRPVSSTQFRLDSTLNNSNSSLLSNHSSGFLDNNSDSDIGEERAPPPLPEKPEKHHYADYSNLPDKETPPPTHTRLGHRKSKPVPPLPTENDTPEPSNPPPVPKKTHHSSSPFSKTNNHK
ncbi:hypothetical protein KUTeg_005196 [Tegillarca granosa]|uniref:Uncharacterized protein n=1 Tax=Tegillarca granosa TaxID=220873 RepID=A0ABQ9FMZ2_TEGGR|nr:hypothetical protein KUTeg_005196 [Tegillarca granosa]